MAGHHDWYFQYHFCSKPNLHFLNVSIIGVILKMIELINISYNLHYGAWRGCLPGYLRAFNIGEWYHKVFNSILPTQTLLYLISSSELFLISENKYVNTKEHGLRLFKSCQDCQHYFFCHNGESYMEPPDIIIQSDLVS